MRANNTAVSEVSYEEIYEAYAAHPEWQSPKFKRLLKPLVESVQRYQNLAENDPLRPLLIVVIEACQEKMKRYCQQETVLERYKRDCERGCFSDKKEPFRFPSLGKMLVLYLSIFANALPAAAQSFSSKGKSTDRRTRPVEGDYGLVESKALLEALSTLRVKLLGLYKGPKSGIAEKIDPSRLVEANPALIRPFQLIHESNYTGLRIEYSSGSEARRQIEKWASSDYFASIILATILATSGESIERATIFYVQAFSQNPNLLSRKEMQSLVMGFLKTIVGRMKELSEPLKDKSKELVLPNSSVGEADLIFRFTTQLYQHMDKIIPIDTDDPDPKVKAAVKDAREILEESKRQLLETKSLLEVAKQSCPAQENKLSSYYYKLAMFQTILKVLGFFAIFLYGAFQLLSLGRRNPAPAPVLAEVPEDRRNKKREKKKKANPKPSEPEIEVPVGKNSQEEERLAERKAKKEAKLRKAEEAKKTAAMEAYDENISKLKEVLEKKERRFIKFKDTLWAKLEEVKELSEGLRSEQNRLLEIKPKNYEENKEKRDAIEKLSNRILLCEEIQNLCETLFAECEVFIQKYRACLKKEYSKEQAILLDEEVKALEGVSEEIILNRETSLRKALKAKVAALGDLLSQKKEAAKIALDTSQKLDEAPVLEEPEMLMLEEKAQGPVEVESASTRKSAEILGSPTLLAYQKREPVSDFASERRTPSPVESASTRKSPERSGSPTLFAYQKSTPSSDFASLEKEQEKVREVEAKNLGWMKKPLLSLLQSLKEILDDPTGDYKSFPMIRFYSLLYRLHNLQLFLLVAYSYGQSDKIHEENPIEIPLLFRIKQEGLFDIRFWNLLMHKYFRITDSDLRACVQSVYCKEPLMFRSSIRHEVSETNLWNTLTGSQEDQDHYSVEGQAKALKKAFEDLVAIEGFVKNQKDPDRIQDQKFLPHYLDSCKMILMIIGQIAQNLYKNQDKYDALFGHHEFFMTDLRAFLAKCRILIRNPERHDQTLADRDRGLLFQRLKDIHQDAREGRTVRIDITEPDMVFKLVDEGREIFCKNPKLFEEVLRPQVQKRSEKRGYIRRPRP